MKLVYLKPRVGSYLVAGRACTLGVVTAANC
jgi:hypothetical protein